MGKLRLFMLCGGVALALPIATALVLPAVVSERIGLDEGRLQRVARAHANFSKEQGQAVRAELRAQLHPSWDDMSWGQRLVSAAVLARRAIRASFAAVITGQTAAPFVGNQTVISYPNSTLVSLQRQGDCSLTLYGANYTLNPSLALQLEGSVTNYQDTLHGAAGLGTAADSASGCAEPTLGLGTRLVAYLGKTTAGYGMVAGVGYNASGTGPNYLMYSGTLNPVTLAMQTQTSDASLAGLTALTAGDLNGDGMADVIGIDGSQGQIGVWLASTAGTLGTPAFYSVPGSVTETALVADVNGDGKADVVVASRTAAGQEEISVLTGNGNGLLNAAQSINIATPLAGATRYPLVNLVAADLRGSGKPDLVGSNGLVLLNNGSGTFTAAPAAAFAPIASTAESGPNLAAGDFNNDGKPDLAVATGVAVSTFMGVGDGSFTAGHSYDSINDFGYVAARDLDNDGNVDLYVGLANGGYYGGDQYTPESAYALMGNGDGTFRGSPTLPFEYTGKNLVDLDGDGKPDGVGVNADLSFTSYLGSGTGAFAAHATLATSPVTVGGVSYPLQDIDSFALADVDGDGHADLVYIAPVLNGIPSGSGGTGVFLALGDGQGGFGAPSFVAVPAVSSTITGAYTIYPTLTNLHLADVNHDGKADLIYNYEYSYQSTANVNSTDAGTAIQLSNGDGTFQAPQQIVFYSGPNLLGNLSGGISNGIPYQQWVALAQDLTGDGNPDLVFVTQSNSIDSTLSAYTAGLQVAVGHGDGTFTTPAAVSGPDIMVLSVFGMPPAVVAADMDGDGHMDLVALGSSSNYNAQLAVIRGNGDGTFKAPQLREYAAQYLNNSQGIAVADFDGDGKPDVAVTDPYSASGSGIFPGNGDGTVQSIGSGSSIEPVFAINLVVGGATTALDLTGDGLPELVSGDVELVAQAATTPVPAFALSATSTSATLTAGQSATTTIDVTPSGGFSGSVALTCSGLPTGASCGFAPATVTVNGSVASSALTITTTGQAALLGTSQQRDPLAPWLPGVALAALLLPATRGRWTKTALRRYQILSCLLLACALLASCGGGSGGGGGGSGSSTSSSSSSSSSGGTGSTPAGTYIITVTGTSGTTSHTVNYSLTVQ